MGAETGVQLYDNVKELTTFGIWQLNFIAMMSSGLARNARSNLGFKPANTTSIAQMAAYQKPISSTKIFKTGDLYESFIEFNGHRVELLAEIETDGTRLILKDIVIYSNEGDIPNEVGLVELRTWLNVVKEEARAQGFTVLQIIGQRAEHSTSANPGSIINRTFNLETRGILEK